MSLTNDNPNCRYSETASGATIQIVVNVPVAPWPAAEPLVQRLKELKSGAAVPPLTNRQKVRALIRRCELAGHEVRVKDLIAAADIDESSFFKWQRDERVSAQVRERCEKVIGQTTSEFVRRYLAKPASKDPSSLI